MPSAKGNKKQAKTTTTGKSRGGKTKPRSTAAERKVSVKASAGRARNTAGRVKSAQKAAAAEKVVSRKVASAASKDKAARRRVASKGKMTKATATKTQVAKSRESRSATAARRATSAAKSSKAAAAAASRAKKKAVVAAAKPAEVKANQVRAAGHKKATVKATPVPSPVNVTKPLLTAKSPVAAALSPAELHPATPPASTPAPRPPTASDRIQVTEKKIAQPASLSTAKSAKPPASSAPAAAGGVLPAAPKAATEKPSSARPVSAPPARVSAAAPAATAAAAPTAASKPPAAKTASESKAPAAKSGVHRTGFKTHEFIVYPAHGVGQIIAIEEQEVAGFKLELFVINFVKDKMTLKVPLPKVLNGAIRKLAEPETAKKSLDTLTGRARIKRTMWSRRAQEYEAKINSGDLIAIAEVVRDLYRSDAQPEQSYSERQLYEAALDRMAREIAAVEKLVEIEALKLIETHLQRGPRRGARGESGAEEAADEGEIEEAA